MNSDPNDPVIQPVVGQSTGKSDSGFWSQTFQFDSVYKLLGSLIAGGTLYLFFVGKEFSYYISRGFGFPPTFIERSNSDLIYLGFRSLVVRYQDGKIIEMILLSVLPVILSFLILVMLASKKRPKLSRFAAVITAALLVCGLIWQSNQIAKAAASGFRNRIISNNIEQCGYEGHRCYLYTLSDRPKIIGVVLSGDHTKIIVYDFSSIVVIRREEIYHIAEFKYN